MSLIQFVRNSDDLSTDRGYQFKFYCDKCGNGYLSSFQPSVIGTAGSLLKAAGGMFGGAWVSGAGNSAYELQRVVGGKAHDSALSQAVQEGMQRFHQCSRCGRWVCPEVCWNSQSNMCDDCAPKIQEEMASAQAQAKAESARRQLFDRARQTDYASDIDMSANSFLSAPSSGRDAAQKGPANLCAKCGSDVGTSKFCPECGAHVVSSAGAAPCNRCGFQPQAPTKFCPECGNHL